VTWQTPMSRCVRVPRLAVTAILFWCTIRADDASGSLLANAPAQPEALAILDTPDVAPSEADVLMALERGWFDAAKRSLALMRSRGDAVASLAAVRTSATRIRDQATEVINLMRTGANAEETVVSTAFQWAQRPDFIFLNVKFSSRIDGPVTCLNVDDERIVFGNDTIFFEGTGRQKPKLFRLNLTFYGAILPESSSWSFASVGRISVTIQKAVNETWPRLLQDKKKPKNMHAWYERQTVLDAEVKKEKEERKKAREAEEAAAKADVPPSTPPAPSAPGDAPPPPPDGETAPSPPLDAAAGTAATAKKGKGSGKGVGGKKKKAKKEAVLKKDEM